MRKHFLSLLWLIGLATALPAEELITLPILALVVQSDEIWEAEPLHPDSTLVFSEKKQYNEVRWLRVRLTEIYRSQLFRAGDTVWVSIGSIYDGAFDGSRSISNTISRLLLFCRGSTAEQYRQWYGEPPVHDLPVFADLSLSGIRLLDHRQNVYYPFQLENPGNFQFLRSEKARWADLQAQTQHDIRRVDTLFAIRAIENPVEQNDLLFAWIKCHADELREDHSTNNWYWYRDLSFVWILCNGITEQAWEAIVLYHHIFPTEVLGRAEWPYVGELPKPFCDAGSLFFLLDKIRQRDLASGLHRAALWNFGDACHNTELSESTRAALFRDLTDVYPRIEAVLREPLVRAAASLAFRHEKPPVADALSFFIKTRQDEPPGDLRNALSEIVVRHCSANAWEAISGNQGQVLIRMNGFYYDSLKQHIRFHFLQQFGAENLYEQPILEWYQMDEKGRPINRREQPLPIYYPKIDWANGSLRNSGAASVELFVGDAPRGTWYFRTKGTAGREQQFRWKSELAVFEW
jgi:hypothetical protein